MKNAFLVIGLCLSFTGTFAQKVYVGLEGGVCFTDVKIDDRDTYEKEYRNRMSVGMNYELIFNNRIVIGTGLSYAQKGFKEYSLWVDYINSLPIPVVTKSDYYNKYSYDYLVIPVKFGYSMGSKFIVTPKIGIYSSYLVKAQSIVPEPNARYNSSAGYVRYDIRDQVSTFDFGGLAEIEGAYTIDKVMLFSSFGYSHGLIPVTTADDHSSFYYEREIRHEVISLTIGMKLMLK